MRTKQPLEGTGSLTIPLHPAWPTTYDLLLSGRQLRGSVTGEPDAMREAFRAGEAVLAVEGGGELRVRITAHTEGGDRAWFEAEGSDRILARLMAPKAA